MNIKNRVQSFSLNSVKLTYVLLGLIIIFSIFFRTYKLGSIPPSVSWDEAAVGYNAYGIAFWGRDEWGQNFPLVFKSFEDDKRPVHVYFTALAVRLLGLSEFSTRLAPAIFGVFSVITIFFLGKILFSSNLFGLIAAFFLSISPYNLQFSRFNHEASFALFFFMFGLLMFLLATSKKPLLIIPSFISFGVSILAYHSGLVFTSLMMLVLIFIYIKTIFKLRKYFALGVLAFIPFILIIVFNPGLLGTARIKQNAIQVGTIQATDTYKKTHNELLGRLELMAKYYSSHFTFDYLFVSGDPIPRHSIQTVGEFYKIDAILLVVGLLGLILKRSKASLIILSWAFLAPIPASASPGANGWGHAARALFMMGSFHLISAYGLYFMFTNINKKWLKISLILIVLSVLLVSFKDYLIEYYTNYSKKQAIEWQYGFKEIAKYIEDNPDYHFIYVTDIRSQPYIFMLFYLKTPLPEYLATKFINRGHTRPSNLIHSFKNYIFADWDPIESMPQKNVLYVVGPSSYDGLRYRIVFSIKKLVKYPNGTDAFFLVSYP